MTVRLMQGWSIIPQDEEDFVLLSQPRFKYRPRVSILLSRRFFHLLNPRDPRLVWDAGHIGRDRVLFAAAPRTQTLGIARTEKGTKSSSVWRFRPNILQKRG